jgi:hypothetical protein
VPSAYVGRIRLPFDYLCDGTADADGDSTCPGEETCKIGTCEAAAVPPSEVIPVPPAGSTPTTRVDGGGGGKVDDGCFDVVACMAAGTRIPVDPDGCRLTLPSTYAPDHVNVAITLAPGSKGVCAPDGGSCYAVLSAGSGGWSLDGTRRLSRRPGPEHRRERRLLHQARRNTRLRRLVVRAHSHRPASVPAVHLRRRTHEAVPEVRT